MRGRTIRTPDNARAFLDALADTASVRKACEIAGIGRMSVYEWRDDDADFKAAWEAALDLGTDALEDEMVRRAMHGTDKPVYQKGELVGYVREYSDNLLTLALKTRRPDKFKDKIQTEHTGKDGESLPVSLYIPSNNRD